MRSLLRRDDIPDGMLCGVTDAIYLTYFIFFLVFDEYISPTLYFVLVFDESTLRFDFHSVPIFTPFRFLLCRDDILDGVLCGVTMQSNEYCISPSNHPACHPEARRVASSAHAILCYTMLCKGISRNYTR